MWDSYLCAQRLFEVGVVTSRAEMPDLPCTNSNSQIEILIGTMTVKWDQMVQTKKAKCLCLRMENGVVCEDWAGVASSEA